MLTPPVGNVGSDNYMITITTNEHFGLDEGDYNTNRQRKGSLDHDHPNHVWDLFL